MSTFCRKYAPRCSRASKKKDFWARSGCAIAPIVRGALCGAASQLTKALGIAWLGRGFAAEASARGYLTNEGFSGFSAFDPGHDYAASFARYLCAPGRRHLIMCHPGYCDEELVAADPVTLSRERELSFLLSPAFTEMLDRKGARLARLSDPFWDGIAPRMISPWRIFLYQGAAAATGRALPRAGPAWLAQAIGRSAPGAGVIVHATWTYTNYRPDRRLTSAASSANSSGVAKPSAGAALMLIWKSWIASREACPKRPSIGP